MIEIGSTVNNRYKVQKVLGAGGMATVFEAHDDMTRRRVAVKVLHSNHVRDTDLVQRFEEEARLGTSIRHPNVIEVLDFGRVKNLPFMVLEFLEGESLANRIDSRGRMTVAEASDVMVQVLSALDEVHAQGIIHRDLKPDNVQLVPRKGQGDFVKLLDFGVSKNTVGGARARTRTGVVMGTPHYMSPEQALGKRDIDRRTDVYAAGVMLYELVTLAWPFDFNETSELLLAIAYNQPPPKPPRALVPELPEAFEAVVLKAMHHDRETRYSSAAEFRLALAPFASNPEAVRRSQPPPALQVPMSSSPSQKPPPGPAPAPRPSAGPAGAPPGAQQGVPQAAPQGAPRGVPQGSPQGAPRVAPQGVPQGPPGAVPRPGPMPGAAPGAGPSPQRVPGAGPPQPALPVDPGPRGPRNAGRAQVTLAFLVGAVLGGAVVFGAGQALDTVAPSAPARPIMVAPGRAVTAVVGLPPGAELTIDGAVHPERRVFLRPGGQHQVRATAPGFAPFEGTLTATTGGAWAFALTPSGPAAAPSATPPAAPGAPVVEAAPTPPAPAAAGDAAVEAAPEEGDRHRRRHRRHHGDE
ncbi:MAG: protein kinase [Deltaproteobacteria bacterium]|nr:protein kinase [Deltaproteobacteria bacterium]